MLNLVQGAIRWLEVAGGRKALKILTIVLGVAAVAVLFEFRCFRNMESPEAMDAAQLARNISQGKGFTTQFIRPFSMFLQKDHNQLVEGAAVGRIAELTKIKDAHPDISNAPLYPLFLAAGMKILPFQFTLPNRPRLFFSPGGNFQRYQPDFIIALLNQTLFAASIVSLFFLAWRLFDLSTAWLSAILLYLSDLLWRFSVSGLSTMLLILLMTGLAWAIVLFEEEAREVRRGVAFYTLMAVACGVIVGLCALTRYSFGWLIIPVVAFLVVFGGNRRWLATIPAVAVFLVLLAPWVIRNYRVSGTPFGTAGYAIYETSFISPEQTLERSLDPDLHGPTMMAFGHKLLPNLRRILQNDLPKIAGSWIGAFFLIGLFVRFAQPGTARFRYFLMLSLLLLIIVQGLGRTFISEMVPEINGENLLVVLSPFIIVYGVNFFLLLLNQLALPARELRYGVIVLFCIATCFPIVFAFLPPRTRPVVFPPYYPPLLQSASGYMKPNELMMSDIPWAHAWYGNVQSIWLTRSPDAFMEINDYQKPIQAFYIGQSTMNEPFLSYWIQGGEQGWANILLQCPAAMVSSRDPLVQWPKDVNIFVRKTAEETITFPLHFLHQGWPQELMLTSRSTTTTTQ
jgi:hypothetical protein